MERHDYSALRTVLFAGEVFPVKHLRALKALLPKPQYFNLYGPTETNVCTYFEIPERIPEDRVEPFPIGVACSNARAVTVDEAGSPVPARTCGSSSAPRSRALRENKRWGDSRLSGIETLGPVILPRLSEKTTVELNRCAGEGRRVGGVLPR